MDVSLEPTFDLYRPLTATDSALLTFLSTIGAVYRVNDLAKELHVHRNTIRRLLVEYQHHHLLTKVVQFFNLGIDVRIYFYMYAPYPPSKFPFLTQCQSLPRIDMFLSERSSSTVYIGRLDIPSSWTYDFFARLRFLRESFPDLVFLYSLDHPSLARWNLSLQATFTTS